MEKSKQDIKNKGKNKPKITEEWTDNSNKETNNWFQEDGEEEED